LLGRGAGCVGEEEVVLLGVCWVCCALVECLCLCCLGFLFLFLRCFVRGVAEEREGGLFWWFSSGLVWGGAGSLGGGRLVA